MNQWIEEQEAVRYDRQAGDRKGLVFTKVRVLLTTAVQKKRIFTSTVKPKSSLQVLETDEKKQPKFKQNCITLMG